MTPAPDSFDSIEFLTDAVQIPSHEDVTEMREFLVATLESHGVEASVDDAGNALASRGHGAPHVVLNTHVDTVAPHVPFERDGDVVRGRGSCDAKGPLAAMLAAFLSADVDGGRLTLAVTPDEEVYSTGAAAIDLDPDAYVVGEPTGLDVCNAARGRFEGTVRLGGVDAHAGKPDTGVNAVAAAEHALAAVRTFDADRDAHPDLGAPTLTPTRVRGGDATNRVPATCEITVDRRSVPPETADGFRAEFETALRDAVPDDVTVAYRPTDRPTPFLEAFETPVDEQVVRALADAASRATDGDAGEVRPFGAATEASYFAPTPTVVFGPGVLADDDGGVAHSEREYVRVREVETAAVILEDALDTLLG